MFQRPDDDIRSETQRFLTFFFGVAVDIWVVPAIAGIGLIGVEYTEPTIAKKPETLRWFAIVLMSFRYAVRKIEMAMIEAIRKWQFLKILLGKYFL